MWSRNPLVRLLIPYVAGVLFAYNQAYAMSLGYMLLWLCACLLLGGGVFYGLLFSYKNMWLYGGLIILFLFCCGFTITNHRQIHGEKQLSSVSDRQHTYLARLNEPFEMRTRSCRSMISIKSVRDSIGWQDLHAKIMIYTEPDSSLLTVPAGTYLLFQARIKPIRPAANPGEFNYKEYLSLNGIYHSTYLKRGQWQISSISEDFNLLRYASAIRDKLLEKLNENGVTGKHFGIASALLLGEDSQLDADVRDIYARAGAMHILCVSGLHVGVIFLVLNFVLGFLKRNRPGKFILPILLMLCIWCYALVTGLAPPVVRASCMISFFILGNSLGKQNNVYNTLAASALLMLMLNPFVLFSAGFQLSYTAVIGIISLQRPIYHMFYFKYALPDKIWALTSVSIAAQIGTLPVVLYYFHQFPIYSLLTNLIVIPLSSLIIYAGIALLFMPSFSIPATSAAWFLNKLIMIMDAGVSFIEKIPYGMAEGVFIDIPEAIMISLIICCIALFLIGRHKIGLFFFLMLLLLFSLYRLEDQYHHQQQQIFVVYSVNGHSAYNTIQGHSHIFFADSALLASEAKLDYSINPYWLEKGLNKPDIKLLSVPDPKEYGICKVVKGTRLRIVVWSGKLPHCHPPDVRLKPDCLIIRGHCPFELEDIFQWFDPEIVILDTSVPPWIEVPEGDGRFWNVRKRGAYTISDS